MALDEIGALIHTTALCEMLLESLERLEASVASDEFAAELREVCERARAELGRRESARPPTAG